MGCKWVKSRGSQINAWWENHLHIPITVSAESLGLLLCAESCRKSQQSRISRKTSGASACGPSQKETTKTIALLAVQLLRVPGGTSKWNMCVSKHCRTLQNPLFGCSYRNRHMMRVRGSFSILYTALSSAWLELTQGLHLFKNILKCFCISQTWAPKITYHFGTSLRKLQSFYILYWTMDTFLHCGSEMDICWTKNV